MLNKVSYLYQNGSSGGDYTQYVYTFKATLLYPDNSVRDVMIMLSKSSSWGDDAEYIKVYDIQNRAKTQDFGLNELELNDNMMETIELEMMEIFNHHEPWKLQMPQRLEWPVVREEELLPY